MTNTTRKEMVGGWDLLGSVGHELRHALEVLDNPSVTSNAAMYAPAW